MTQSVLDAAVAQSARFGHAKHELLQALEAGGNPNAVDQESGMSALYWACKRSMTPMAQLLCEHGADPNQSVQARDSYPRDMTEWRHEVGSIALHKAAPSPQLLAIILPHVHDVNARDSMEWTALHKVCSYFSSTPDLRRAVKLLLAAGADPTLKDKYSITPLTMADKYMPDIAEMIRAYQSSSIAEKIIKHSVPTQILPLL